MKKWVNAKSGLMLLGIALLVSLVILNDRATSQETLKLILKSGFKISKP